MHLLLAEDARARTKAKRVVKETTNCQNDSSSRKALKMRPVQRVSAYSPSHEPDKARERG